MTEPPPTPSDGVAFDFDRSGRVTNLRLAPDWHVLTPPALLGMTLTAQLHQHSLGRSLEAMEKQPSASTPPTVALAREIQARGFTADTDRRAGARPLREEVLASGDSVSSQRAHATVCIVWGEARSVHVDPSFAARGPRQAIIDEVLECLGIAYARLDDDGAQGVWSEIDGESRALAKLADAVSS